MVGGRIVTILVLAGIVLLPALLSEAHKSESCPVTPANQVCEGTHHSPGHHHHHGDHHDHDCEHHDHDHDHGRSLQDLGHNLSKMDLWMHAMASSFLVSMASLICLTLIAITGGKKLSPTLVDALAAFGGGAMMGDAFLHQLPHAFGRQAHSHSHHDHDHDDGDGTSHSHSLEDIYIGLSILGGIILFFLIEKMVRYVEERGGGRGHHHHHHRSENTKEASVVDNTIDKSLTRINEDVQQEHPSIPVLGLLNLFTDGVHNLTDGIALGAAFLAYGTKGGWYRAWFLLCHEIPQEVGDFGILVRSGFSAFKALAFNFLSALLAVAGAALVLVIGADFGNSSLIEGFTAGGFLYISLAGVLPEMHQQKTSLKGSVLQLAALCLGIGAAVLLSLTE